MWVKLFFSERHSLSRFERKKLQKQKLAVKQTKENKNQTNLNEISIACCISDSPGLRVWEDTLYL